MSTRNHSIVLYGIFVTCILLQCLPTTSTKLCYMQKDEASLLPFVPKRLTQTFWSNVSSAVDCARSSYSSFPDSRGFLFNLSSGQCWPLLWLEGPSSPQAEQVQPEDGNLYLSCDVCGDDFHIFELDNTAGELVCLKYYDVFMRQAEAVSQCAAVGAYLPPVKTKAKLDIIRSLAAYHVWIGFEYLASMDSHVWSRDQEVITNQQMVDVFFPGEPNNFYGDEECGVFRTDFQALNDIGCWREYHFICEKDLPVADS